MGAWGTPEVVPHGWSLNYRRLDKQSCILVRHNGDDDMVVVLGNCNAPAQYTSAKRGGMQVTPLEQVEFQAVGKAAEIEVVRAPL